MAVSNTAKDLINEVVYYANANAEDPCEHYLRAFKRAMVDLEDFIQRMESKLQDLGG